MLQFVRKESDSNQSKYKHSRNDQSNIKKLQNLWLDKYKVESSSDLAIHHTKIKAITDWISRATCAHSELGDLPGRIISFLIESDAFSSSHFGLHSRIQTIYIGYLWTFWNLQKCSSWNNLQELKCRDQGVGRQQMGSEIFECGFIYVERIVKFRSKKWYLRMVWQKRSWKLGEKQGLSTTWN